MTMEQRTKRIIHNTNQFLNRPITVIIVLLILFGYFAYGNAQFQKDNRTIINQTNKSAANSEIIVNQLKKVLCENIPQKDCNLSQAVAQLKMNNDEQTILLCKLFLSGNAQLNSEDASEVEAICKARIKSFSNGSTTPASTDTSSQDSPQTKSTNQTPQSHPGNSDNTLAPDNDGVILDLPFLPKVHIGSPF